MHRAAAPPTVHLGRSHQSQESGSVLSKSQWTEAHPEQGTRTGASAPVFPSPMPLRWLTEHRTFPSPVESNRIVLLLRNCMVPHCTGVLCILLSLAFKALPSPAPAKYCSLVSTTAKSSPTSQALHVFPTLMLCVCSHLCLKYPSLTLLSWLRKLVHSYQRLVQMPPPL